MPSTIESDVYMSKYPSKGLFRRIYNTIEVSFHQGDINHVTGDVHFLSYFLKRERTILTIHDCVSVMHSTGIRREIFKFFWFTLPVKRVRHITVVSNKTKQELLSIVDVPQERISVIPNCISKAFQPIEKKSFDQKRPRILQVGTLFNKNLSRLCQALEGISCTLEIIGRLSTEQSKLLERYKIEYENFIDLTDEEMIERYQSADMMTFVSTYEGFGLPVLEAQATGTVLVSSDIDPIRDIAGEGACLVDPKDVQDIRRGILKVIENVSYREQLVQYGLENVKNYQPEHIAQLYSHLYKSIFDKI